MAYRTGSHGGSTFGPLVELYAKVKKSLIHLHLLVGDVGRTRSLEITLIRTRSFRSSTLLAWTCRDEAKRAVRRTTTVFAVAVAVITCAYIC